MAVTAVTTSMAGAINYTFITDTSADFASVANSTYFYNKADKLVRYKDSTGTVLEIFSAGGGAAFPYTGSAVITGSLTITGSLNVTNGITGSLQGTASYSLTASFIDAGFY